MHSRSRSASTLRLCSIFSTTPRMSASGSRSPDRERAGRPRLALRVPAAFEVAGLAWLGSSSRRAAVREAAVTRMPCAEARSFRSSSSTSSSFASAWTQNRMLSLVPGKRVLRSARA